jgi:4-amino-4-deoxy-L-arabinose transferase-like glycosyltransferase
VIDPGRNAWRTDGSLVPPAGWLAADDESERPVGAGFLLVIALLALGLRLLRLDGMSIWVDEVFTWQLVAPSADAEFVPRILMAYQGPLYHAAVWPLLRIADTAFMLRLPSALASGLTVPLVALFAGRLWGRDAGRLAGVLALVSPFALWYAQEARGYAFVMLFATASGLVMIDAMRQGISTGRALGLVVLIAAGLLSNFSFVFLLVAYGLTVLVMARPDSVRGWVLWAVALGGGVLLAGPWLLKAAGIWEVGRVMPGSETGASLRGETTFSPWALPFSGFSLLYGFSLGPSLAELHRVDRLDVVVRHSAVIAAGAIAAAVPLLMALTGLARRRWAVLLWIAVPVAAAVLLAVRNVKPYNVRYVAVIWPWLVVLLACGLTRLALWPRRVLGGVIVVLCVISLLGFHLDGEYAKADIRGATRVIVARSGPDTPVLAPTVGLVVRYYLPDGRSVQGCWDEAVLRRDADADALVARQLAGIDDAWLLRARTWDLDPQDRLPGAMRRAGRLVRIHRGPNVTLDRWTRDPRAMEATP